MREVVIPAAILLLGVLIWCLFADPARDAGPALAPGAAGPAVAAPPPEAVSVERNRLAPPAGERPGESTDPPVPAAIPSPEQPPPGTLHLEVRSRADGDPLPAFRYVLVHPGGARTAERVDGHALALRLDLESRVSLTVEAEGFEPSPPIELQLTRQEPERHLPVLLLPAATFAGVELWVQTPDSRPVRQLEVEAIALDRLEPDAGRSLWRRRTADQRGSYRLPDLAPGSYRLRLRALTDAGEIAAFVPHDEDVVFGGSERIRRYVVLRPGGFVEVLVLDGAGRVLGAEVDLRLVHPDGTAPGTRWVAVVDGERIERRDGLPARGVARLAEPVPPGEYLVQARIGEGTVSEQPVPVAAGRAHSITLRLPR